MVPKSCSFSPVFFCRVLNTVPTGKAGLAVWISSRQMCTAEGDSCPLQEIFTLSVSLLTSGARGNRTDSCGFSTGRSGLPSRRRLVLPCGVLSKKIGAILTSFGGAFLQEAPAAAAVPPPGDVPSPKQLDVLTSAGRNTCSLFLLRLSLFCIAEKVTGQTSGFCARLTW